MKKILKIDNPNVFARHVGAPEVHPLLSLIHFDELPPIRHSLNHYGVYGLFIQREFPKNLSYGMSTLQASNVSLIAVAPGQLGGFEDNGERLQLSGWAMLWSPELLHNTVLEAKMQDYEYFSYFATESLRLTPSEWDSIDVLLTHLRQEAEANEDSRPLRSIMLAYLQLILEYCNRIYQRQLSEETKDTNDLLKRFHMLLERYFRERRQLKLGMPTVAYCAQELCYSPHYFGDLIHKSTGSTAIRLIHEFIVNQGKSLLMKGYNINETSRLLGFDYPHHFTRLFKKVTGLTPSEFMGMKK